MNKQQLKIFTSKILPKAIPLILLIGGIIAFCIIQILGYTTEQKLKNWDTQKTINELEKKVTMNKLCFPLYDWKIEKQFTFPKEVGQGGGIILSAKKVDFISILYSTHHYITDLHEYSELANERTVKNMKNAGILLKSKKIEDIKFKDLDAVQETFESLYKPTGEVSEFVATNFKYKGVFYMLSYYNEPSATKLISNIEFLY